MIKGFAECLISEGDQISKPSLLKDQAQSSGAGTGGCSKFIHHIMDSCTHIQHILDNSLDLGRLEQHKCVLEDEVVNIKAVCDEIYSMMSVRVKPGVQLVVCCPEVSFQGDRTRWLQLLLNLVSNAIKFTVSGFVRLDITAEEAFPDAEKTLSTRVLNKKHEKQHTLVVKVSDTGCGISKAGQASLFQKYHQVHQKPGPWSPDKVKGRGLAPDKKVRPDTGKTDSRADSGTGLGLVISQHLVLLMGSRSGISVQSPYDSGDNGMNAGTMFSFSVQPAELRFGDGVLKRPLTPAASWSSSQPTKVHTSPAPLAHTLPRSSITQNIRATIMVVDDEHLNRMVMLSKLKQCEQGIHNRLGAIGSDAVHSTAPGEEYRSLCRFSMEVVQADHAEMALSMMDARVEARQKQKAGRRGETEEDDAVDIDIIFLDQHMESSGGVMKGTDALARFRQLARNHDEQQPVIVLTSGNCSKVDQQRYTEMGADFAWPKPYPAGDAIAESLSQWIRDRQPRVFSTPGSVTAISV